MRLTSSRAAAFGALFLFGAAVSGVAIGFVGLEWFLTPLDFTRPHSIDFYASWHARLMVVTWSILLPAGILAARFFKIVPGQDWPCVKDNPTWWKLHLWCQWSGAVIALAAVALIFPHVWRTSSTAAIHRWLGWSVLILLGMQVAGGMLRGSKGGPTKPADDGSWFGDHYNMTPRRVVFEYMHKSTGYATLLMSWAATCFGLWEVNAPRWMGLVLSIWWLAFIVTFLWLQHHGRARDTYEAIWGPDPIHPGNNVRPIGWGIVRATQRDDAEECSSRHRL
ncbi:cytochrome b561 domain-containing protein [Mesorhizobium sp. Cs1299R1N3]|uniref:cytochrome b561 domain-containing protein n=1 Tax=Mesorhizobium sp. Cs1299R1N3 TaxID=3015173 RepID=UPI00301C6D9B